MWIDFNDEPYPEKGTTEQGLSGGGGKLSEPVGVNILGGSRSMLAREIWEMYLKLSCTTKKLNDYFAAVAFESR